MKIDFELHGMAEYTAEPDTSLLGKTWPRQIKLMLQPQCLFGKPLAYMQINPLLEKRITDAMHRSLL